MRVLRLAHPVQVPLGVARHHAHGVEVLRRGVFVVGDHQAFDAAARGAVGAVDGEEVHAVMVVADLARLIGAAVAGVGLEGGRAGEQRIAPAVEHGVLVALGHHDGVGRAHGHGLEVQVDRLGLLRRGLARRRGLGGRIIIVIAATGGQARAHEADRAGAQTGLQEAAARQHAAHHVVEMGAVDALDGMSSRSGVLISVPVMCHSCDRRHLGAACEHHRSGTLPGMTAN